MTTVDSFKSSIVSFNNQWLLVETTTTKQKLATPTKGISLNNATTNLEISSSINCISQDKMEIYHNVVLNGWLIQTVSVFKPQNPVAATQQQTATSSTSQSQLNMSQQTKISSNNKQASQVESPKSTSLGSGDEEIEEEDIEDDEVIDENNQYDPEADDDSDDGQNVEEEISAEQQIASNDQLLYKFIGQLPKKVYEIKPVNNDSCNNKAKSPKQFNSEISAFSSRSTTNNSESNYSVSKISKSLINQIVPAFSCDNIIEDQDKKKRIKKNSILTDDSQNETRQNFETEESLMNSHCGSSTKNSNGDMLIEDQISCSAIPEKDSKVSVNNVKNNSFITITRNSSPSKEASQGEGEQGNKHQKIQLNNNIINQNSPLRNASSSLETAVMMQLNNNGHDSNNDMLQNSSCSQNEDSSNFSIETDKIYNQLLGRKRNILKKAIAKSSNNIDKSLCNISSTNLQNPSTSSSTKPRKSSYLNSIKLASSPSLTNLNYKRDRKNLVKNFIKAFRGFINNASDEPEVLAILKEALSSETTELIQELNSIRKNFEKFISKKNYNNTLMVELIQNQEFNVLFSYFLKEKAQEWIYSSKIKDKLSHEEALNHYLLSLKDSKALAKVRCLKYRSATNIEDAQISPMNSKQGTGEQFEGFN